MRKRLRVFAVMLLLILTMTGQSIQAGVIGKSERKVIRVGFFAFDGYHIEDENGEKSGYGYEVLQKLARYNDWTYEYVGYDKSWGEMQEMLENGEIDMLTSAQKTEERLEKYEFSQKSIGTSATILVTRSGEKAITAGEYDSYNGMKVGMIPGNSRNESFENFAREKGFTYEAVYFDSTQELENALHDTKEIDTIITSNLRSSKDEFILNEFDASPFYVMVQKGDTSLAEQVDYAISQIDANEPGWRYTLFNKYYSASAGTELALSTAERAYLKKLKDSGKVLQVFANPDRMPYSYLEDGELKGISIDIFKEIAKRADISYEFVLTSSREEFRKEIEEGKADIVLDAVMDYYQAESNGFQLTDFYLSTAMARVTRKDHTSDINKAAIPKHASLGIKVQNYVKDTESWDEFESITDCVEALQNGSYDATYLYTYTAQQMADADVRNQITYMVLPDTEVEFAIGVSDNYSHELLSVLNKAVNSVKGTFTQKVVNHHTEYRQRSTTLLTLIYDYPQAVMVFVILLAVIMVFIVVICLKTRHEKQKKEQEARITRLLGYVCRLNDIVVEINGKNWHCRKYIWENCFF